MTLFASYEREGFNINNVCHIFTLQYMFMPRIQEDLDNFKLYWNNHPLATENNRTPLQMILLHTDDINYDEPIDILNYGVEDIADGIEEDNPRVECNPIRCPLSQDNLLIFRETVQPLTMAISDGALTDIFIFALRVLNDLHDHQI
jgi:hypothetical protein